MRDRLARVVIRERLRVRRWRFARRLRRLGYPERLVGHYARLCAGSDVDPRLLNRYEDTNVNHWSSWQSDVWRWLHENGDD